MRSIVYCLFFSTTPMNRHAMALDVPVRFVFSTTLLFHFAIRAVNLSLHELILLLPHKFNSLFYTELHTSFWCYFSHSFCTSENFKWEFFFFLFTIPWETFEQKVFAVWRSNSPWYVGDGLLRVNWEENSMFSQGCIWE